MTDVTPGTPDIVKQIIVLRTDLAMPPGKAASQAAHASIRFMTTRLVSMEATIELPGWSKGPLLETRAAWTEAEWLWLQGQFTKIVCRLKTEEDIEELYAKALNAGLEAHLIIDSGNTVFDGVPTLTALAIGPDYSTKLDPVTGHL